MVVEVIWNRWWTLGGMVKRQVAEAAAEAEEERKLYVK